MNNNSVHSLGNNQFVIKHFEIPFAGYYAQTACINNGIIKSIYHGFVGENFRPEGAGLYLTPVIENGQSKLNKYKITEIGV